MSARAIRRCYHCREVFEPRGPAQLCLGCEATKRERRADYEATRSLRPPTERTRPRPAPRCIDCNARLERRDLKRCESCGAAARMTRHIDTGALVDSVTPYAEDVACQMLVSAHPDGLTLEEIGGAMGFTRQRAEQVEAAAIAKFAKRCELAGITREDFVALVARRYGR